MSVSKLPSGKYRAQVYDRRTRRTLSVVKVLGLPRDHQFSSRRLAEDAVAEARKRLFGVPANAAETTVATFREDWLKGEGQKSSTLIVRRSGTAEFVAEHGTRLVREITREDARTWLKGTSTTGRSRRWQLHALRALFSAAIREDLRADNPFAKLGVTRGNDGNRYVTPPSVEDVARMLDLAWRGASEAGGRLCSDGFAEWLQFAMYTGMRPGEVDALTWENVDLKAGEVHVRRYLSPLSGLFTLPKNGRTRVVAILPPAREALLRAWEERRSSDGAVFLNTRGAHWISTTRNRHWDRLRAAAAPWPWTLYLSTRHYCGWMLYEQLQMDSHDVAVFLGHTDGGELVRTLYGHRTAQTANARILQAFSGAGAVARAS